MGLHRGNTGEAGHFLHDRYSELSILTMSISASPWSCMGQEGISLPLAEPKHGENHISLWDMEFQRRKRDRVEVTECQSTDSRPPPMWASMRLSWRFLLWIQIHNSSKAYLLAKTGRSDQMHGLGVHCLVVLNPRECWPGHLVGS